VADVGRGDEDPVLIPAFLMTDEGSTARVVLRLSLAPVVEGLAVLLGSVPVYSAQVGYSVGATAVLVADETVRGKHARCVDPARLVTIEVISPSLRKRVVVGTDRGGV